MLAATIGNDPLTPDVVITPDKLGRPDSLIQANQSKISYAYDSASLQLDTETISYDLDHNGTYDFTRVIDRSRDTLGRDSGWELKDGTTIENQVTYGYGTTDGRFTAVTGGGNITSPDAFAYGYLANSSLVETITATAGAVHTVTNTWETTRNVLDARQTKVGTDVISKYDYAVNGIGQRTGVTTSGTAFTGTPSWSWGYDSLGQVITADSSVNTSDRSYEYDAIGNRKKSADSLTLPTSDNYVANSLNQYSSITEGGTGVSPVYDFDGNMTSGPLPVAPSANSTLIWDVENRLIEVKNAAGTTIEQNIYDSGSRKIATTTDTTTTIYIYDGWNCIAEYQQEGGTGVPPVLQKTRLWGLDLSGSLQGAGGVGGLLAEKQGSTSYYPTYDGNGNVSEYLTGSGTVAAHFEYDPFGNTVVNTDTGNLFSYRFSTKPLNFVTVLYYYGYRYYDPLTGRWPSRDPIEEAGGINLYGFVGNNGANKWDYLGFVDGLGFWEAVDHYYTGNGKDYHASFSSVDPGWGMDKIFTADPCTHLGAYIFQGKNPRTWKFKDTVDVFSAKEIIYDSGNSGPGRVNVTADAEFSFSGDIPSTGNSSVFGWSFYAELTAEDNIFDFDPQKVGIRDDSGFAYKEAITRLAYYTGKYSGLGKNFNIIFDGSRTIIKSGACCCKDTGKSMLSCSKIGNIIGE